MGKKALLLTLILLLTACSTSIGSDLAVTKDDATTQMHLVDVAANNSLAYSFWSYGNKLYVCKNDRATEGSREMLGAKDCSDYNASTLTVRSTLLAVNMGYGIVTQSVWDDNGELKICDHSNSDFTVIQNCRSFKRPNSLSDSAQLTAINTGSAQNAISYWVETDGTVNMCPYNKDRQGVWGDFFITTPTNQPCSKVDQPAFMPDGNKFVLTAVTFTGPNPIEMIWQDSNGVLVRCEMQKVVTGLGTAYHEDIGNAILCRYWRAPKIDMPPPM